MPSRIKLDWDPTPGETVRETLKELGITQKDAAKIAGLSYASINKIINGKGKITPKIAIGLEKATKVPKVVWINLQNNFSKGSF